ncbi:glutamate-trna ligase [Phaffia rhodozyma]|uniref:glutamate--tRNA ligase n=1 Tax=Phaffia rhodozyma TaxID=264483 RepID=A0A0F7SPM3_PHARH|nr:glutamate-trna ligase [Phaffia rhodozyma]
MSTHSLTLSQTASPFPFGALAGAFYLNTQKDLQGDVKIEWERDGKLSFDGKQVEGSAQVLDALAGAFAGKETAFPVLPTPLTSTVPFVQVTKIFDTLDDWLALRTFFGGAQLSAKDFEVYGSIKSNLPAIGIIRKNLHVHLGRWFNYVDQLPSTLSGVGALSEAKADKGTAKKADISLDLPDAFDGQVVTRFPPEPSGYLHIGHSKAALLNRFFADKYNGKMILRFDDTNPMKEKSEFEDSIKVDLELLGIKFDSVSHTSDHFDLLHSLAIQLIKEGNAYCDDTPQLQMRDERMHGIASARRNLSVEENLAKFDEMTKGTEEGQKWCLRAKMSVDDPNKAMRDTVIYRCVVQPHHRTGTKYLSYPTYDFACPVVDSLEGVTHALRTNEYRDRNPQYFWFIDALKLRKPHIWDFSRLNFVYTLLSKRKLHWFVNEGHVGGWDDPRFPTVRGIRRRGLTVDALKEYIISQGASQSNMTLEWDGIWTINKKTIDPVVPRYWALVEKDLVKVEIVGGPAEEQVKPVPKHKKNADLGNKSTVYSSSILVEQTDAASFDDNEEVTLMDWGNAFVRSKTVSPEGVVTGLKMELHLEGDFKKTKKKVTWLSASSSTNELLPVTLIDYDYLINKKKLEEDDKVDDFVSTITEFKESALADRNVVDNVRKGDTIQFERKGYYICDSDGSDGSPRSFILIPDGRAASVENKAVLAKAAKDKTTKVVSGGGAAGSGKKAKEAAKKAAAAAAEGEKKVKKAAAPTKTPVAGEKGIKINLSDATSGFEIPVSTTMFETKRIYGEEDIKVDSSAGGMYKVEPYTSH